MKQRIITALILAPLVILGIFQLSLPLFVFAISAIGLIASWEWTQFIEPAARIRNVIIAATVLGVSFCLLPFDGVALQQVLPAHQSILVIGSVWWIISSGLALTYPRSTRAWQNSKWLRHLFGFLSIIPFLWSVFLLRAQDYAHSYYHGAKLVLFVCLLVWAADTGAYFTGKSIGKHKMAPKVSPNKTIEGLFGGVLAAMIVGWFFSGWFDIHFASLTTMLIITFITVVISVLGDLVESMFKRQSNIKDSGQIIPGHGGVLDRIDSLMAAFPVFALLYFGLQ